MKIRQHYVPKFYLEKFAIRRKRGFIIKCFDKVNQKSYVENIHKIGMEKYFFDKNDPPLIEERFAEKEYEHSKLYHKIVSQKSILNVKDSEKLKICEYIFFQNERTRATRERNKQITREVYKYLEKVRNLPKFEKLPPGYQQALLESRGGMAQLNIIFNIYVDENGNKQSPDDIIKYIADLGWNLTRNNLSKEFYTSDHPIVVYNPIFENNRIIGYGSNSYRAEGVEIYFPLTPQLCLILYDKQRSEYKDVPSERNVIEKELNWINKQIVAKAYRMVFSRTNDFQFVKDFLKEYPELKDLNRSRIIY